MIEPPSALVQPSGGGVGLEQQGPTAFRQPSRKVSDLLAARADRLAPSHP